MNPNFRVASIDGFGERDDIALERSRDEDTIRENLYSQQFEIYEAVDRAREFGVAENAVPITGIIQEMIENEVWGILLLKSEVIWDVETISEAVTEACIWLGLSDEEFAPSVIDHGNEIEIRLF